MYESDDCCSSILNTPLNVDVSPTNRKSHPSCKNIKTVCVFCGIYGNQNDAILTAFICYTDSFD